MINAPELLTFSMTGYESVPGISTTWNNVKDNRALMSAQSSASGRGSTSEHARLAAHGVSNHRHDVREL